MNTDTILRRAEHEISYRAKRAIEMFIPVYDKDKSLVMFDKCAERHALCQGEIEKCRDLMVNMGLSDITTEEVTKTMNDKMDWNAVKDLLDHTKVMQARLPILSKRKVELFIPTELMRQAMDYATSIQLDVELHDLDDFEK